MLKKLKWIICFLGLTLCMQVAYADAGLPMIIMIMPGMIILLIPVILIEAYVLKKYLQVKFLKTLSGATIGNVISTIVGVPLTWGTLVILQFLSHSDGAYGLQTWWQKAIAITFQGAWLVPYEDQFFWMVPAAMAFLMIPFFFVSWAIEGFFVKITIAHSLRSHAYRASFYANLCSYAFLEFCIFIFLIKNIVQQSMVWPYPFLHN